jgi:hypothetical protein
MPSHIKIIKHKTGPAMKKFLFALSLLLPLLATAQSDKAYRPLFDSKSIGEIKIKLPVAKWVDALDSMRIYGMGMLSGTASVDGVMYDGVGIRFRGDKSYQKGLKRNPLTIKLNYGKNDQNHQGYSQIKLSSSLRDPSMVREVLFHEIAAQYMPSSQTSYTKLYVNDEYLGVFVNIESVDKSFLERNYSQAKGAFFKAGVDYKPEGLPAACKQNLFGSLEYEENVDCYKGNFEMQSSGGWADLQELTRVLSTGDAAKIDRILDVDRTLWMLALNNVLVNLNSYSGNHSVNYYLYKDPTGRFQPAHWDLNLSFGSYKNTGAGSDLDLKALQNLDPMLHADNPYKPLIHQLLKDPLYKKIYLSHIRQIIEDNILNGSYLKRAQDLQGLIIVPYSNYAENSYSKEDLQKSLRETVGKKSKIPGLSELMDKRGQFLKKHPELTALPSAVTEVSFSGRAKFDNGKANTYKLSLKADRFPKRVWFHYRFDVNEPFMSVLMTEDAGNALPSGVKAFAHSFDAPSADAVLHYYIMVENTGTVSYAPAAYTKQPSKEKLGK